MECAAIHDILLALEAIDPELKIDPELNRGWQDQSETDRVDVDSIDPTNRFGIGGIDRVRKKRTNQHWAEVLDRRALAW